MKVEELLKLLRDGGMADEDIKALLEEAIKALVPAEVPAEEPKPEVEETEDEKMNRVFGI